MGKDEELKKVIKLITWWIAEIKANNYVNLYDINKVAEDLSRSLLNYGKTALLFLCLKAVQSRRR